MFCYSLYSFWGKENLLLNLDLKRKINTKLRGSLFQNKFLINLKANELKLKLSTDSFLEFSSFQKVSTHSILKI
jgi:hypothetical protein